MPYFAASSCACFKLRDAIADIRTSPWLSAGLRMAAALIMAVERTPMRRASGLLGRSWPFS